MERFANWLNAELRKRKWKQADLIRSTGLDSSTISNIFNGKRNVGVVACKAIAAGLGVELDEVLEMAGIRLPKPQENKKVKRIARIVADMPEDEQDYILEVTEGRQRILEERGYYGSDGKARKGTAANRGA